MGLNDGGGYELLVILMRVRDWFGLRSDTMKCQPRVVQTGMFAGIYKVYESSV
jgi:hypothetical protein